MQAGFSNPRVSVLLLAVTAFEVSVLTVASIGLFFLPDFFQPLWPWQLAPFNMAFLGAVYFASMFPAAMIVYAGRWSPARIVLPMILVFTAIILVLTLIYLDRFDVTNPSTWIWLLLYIVIPANALYHLWLYRKWTPAKPEPINSRSPAILLALAALYGLYGVGLLVVPGMFSAFWPWQIDAFHARMYSVAFITPALGFLLISRAAAWAEIIAMTWSLTLGGALPILGLWMVDGRENRIDWTGMGTWLWVSLFAGFILSGVWLLWETRRLPQPKGQPNEAGFFVSPRLLALVFGVLFIAAGVGGFLPAFTHPTPDGMPHLSIPAGYGLLLGLFPINVVHNTFHLLLGLFGLAAGAGWLNARRYLQAFAIALGGLTIAGLLPGFNSLFGLAPVFGHDVWLHGVEALAAGYVGFLMPSVPVTDARSWPESVGVTD